MVGSFKGSGVVHLSSYMRAGLCSLESIIKMPLCLLIPTLFHQFRPKSHRLTHVHPRQHAQNRTAGETQGSLCICVELGSITSCPHTRPTDEPGGLVLWNWNFPVVPSKLLWLTFIFFFSEAVIHGRHHTTQRVLSSPN